MQTQSSDSSIHNNNTMSSHAPTTELRAQGLDDWLNTRIIRTVWELWMRIYVEQRNGKVYEVL